MARAQGPRRCDPSVWQAGYVVVCVACTILPHLAVLIDSVMLAERVCVIVPACVCVCWCVCVLVTIWQMQCSSQQCSESWRPMAAMTVRTN